MIPRPVVSRHYALGLLVGTGFGLFLSGLMADSGIGTEPGSRRLISLVGLLAMMVGGFFYGSDIVKTLKPLDEDT
ncbi:hypothetical protein FGO68_gene13302 [Halteria grandinella]|uniref:Uncharacterized protein n=1 Tax=Halteria grandinella TaxID=5974 RepID=A0A8J8NBI9_HALGN|nr:hypothetical protein FGO68_gene13302 [Halteria grandinella]